MNDILLRQFPFGQYEYVDVEFVAADTDVSVPLTNIRHTLGEDVRWLDVTPSAQEGGTIPRVYKVSGQVRKQEIGIIVLRCNVAGYRTRLLLFTERDE